MTAVRRPPAGAAGGGAGGVLRRWNRPAGLPFASSEEGGTAYVGRRGVRYARRMRPESSFLLRPASMDDVDAITALVAAASSRRTAKSTSTARTSSRSWRSRRRPRSPHPGGRGRGLGRGLGGARGGARRHVRGRAPGPPRPGDRLAGSCPGCEQAARGAGLGAVRQTAATRRETPWLCSGRGAGPPGGRPGCSSTRWGTRSPDLPRFPTGSGSGPSRGHRRPRGPSGGRRRVRGVGGPGRAGFEEWVGHTVGRETFDPRLSPVAVEGDAIVGVVISLAYEGDDDGYVHQLAVERSHRNRGIGRALLVEAFRGFHRLDAVRSCSPRSPARERCRCTNASGCASGVPTRASARTCPPPDRPIDPDRPPC
jgi:GNAT superfamily N-acetyltransferase